MSDIITQPKWYSRYGLECYSIIKVLTHKLLPMEVHHMGNHVKYCFRWLEKHSDPILQEQDLDKANETWDSFYKEAKQRFVRNVETKTKEEIMIEMQLENDED
jgi:hypothetical protein